MNPPRFIGGFLAVSDSPEALAALKAISEASPDARTSPAMAQHWDLIRSLTDQALSHLEDWEDYQRRLEAVERKGYSPAK